MLDYKDIITRHYALEMSGKAIAESLGVSPSGVNDFLRAFKECRALGYPLVFVNRKFSQKAIENSVTSVSM